MAVRTVVLGPELGRAGGDKEALAHRARAFSRGTATQAATSERLLRGPSRRGVSVEVVRPEGLRSAVHPGEVSVGARRKVAATGCLIATPASSPGGAVDKRLRSANSGESRVLHKKWWL